MKSISRRMSAFLPVVATLAALFATAISSQVRADAVSLRMRYDEPHDPARPFTVSVIEKDSSDPLGRALTLRRVGDGTWTGGILFDDAVRNVLRARSYVKREAADFVSDSLVAILVALPVADAALYTGLKEKQGMRAVEFILMDAASYAVTGGIAWVIKTSFDRERPYGRGCDTDPDYSENCKSKDRFKSFLSGHTALSMTAAGLLCAQHGEYRILGGRADTALCAGAIGAAGVTGLMRIVSDNHYATDVLAGAALGFVSGYVLPKMLYETGVLEGRREGEASATSRGSPGDGPAPMVTIFSYGGSFR